MRSHSSNHTPATFLMNSGFTFNGFPSAGAWVSYGLGSENQNLPAFVVLPDPRQLPAGGAINWTSGFLPAAHRASRFAGGGDAIPDLTTPRTFRWKSVPTAFGFCSGSMLASPRPTRLSPRWPPVCAPTLTAQMQLAVPELANLEGRKRHDESASTVSIRERPHGSVWAELFARTAPQRTRRAVRAGVQRRTIRLPASTGMRTRIVENHRKQALVMDQPVAALVRI
jgi:hypothetical protein